MPQVRRKDVYTISGKGHASPKDASVTSHNTVIEDHSKPKNYGARFRGGSEDQPMERTLRETGTRLPSPEERSKALEEVGKQEEKLAKQEEGVVEKLAKEIDKLSPSPDEGLPMPPEGAALSEGKHDVQEGPVDFIAATPVVSKSSVNSAHKRK